MLACAWNVRIQYGETFIKPTGRTATIQSPSQPQRKTNVDRLIAEASPEQREEWPRLIEQGWKEAQAGQLVDGPELMGRLLRRAMEQAGQPERATPPPSAKRPRK